ncbi:hypothetical protein [Cellulomonas sp.]|uniref:hypothetical protein n=1 Tax=Cellulomonas sp. TaxID=40001 RepID=UPI003BACDA6A
MKRAIVAALAAVVMASLAACDPYGPSGQTDAVDIDVVVNTDGSTTAQVFLDDSAARSDAQLLTWGHAIGTRLFPAATSLAVRVEPNGAGYPFAVIDAPDVYEPGPHPRVSLDTRDAVAWILAQDATLVDVYVSAPGVPLTSSWEPSRGQDVAEWAWMDVSDATDAPVGVVVMSPEPWLGLLAVTLTALGAAVLVGAFVALRRRHRAVAIALAGAALVTSLAVLLRGGANLPDNLGVAGVASNAWVQVAAIVTALAVLEIPAACTIVAAAVSQRPPSTHRFVPAPGWPTPPAGWRPPPRWQPDPSWPAAPAGWKFYAEPTEKPADGPTPSS